MSLQNSARTTELDESSRILKLPITVLVATRNEESNIRTCLRSLSPAARVIVVDSKSSDETVAISLREGAEVVEFVYCGGYPKKRQWALDCLDIATPWVMFVDADECIPVELWTEISGAIVEDRTPAAFSIIKGFHFLGNRMVFGGFSHSAVLLFRIGAARFERLFDDAENGLDMEVHERLIVYGRIRRLRTPLIHQDFKGLEAYIARHNSYSTWEAMVRHLYLTEGRYGQETIIATPFGNSQARRRWLKKIIIRLPLEHWLWFVYHFFIRLGFVHGRAGLIAAQIRSSYIQQTNAKRYELQLRARALKSTKIPE